MSTETQPSEHAMRAADVLDTNLYISFAARQCAVSRAAKTIDQHAIAPAVAERDRRIAELETMLWKYVEACYDGGENLSSIRNEELHAEASAILAKYGGAHE